MKKKLLIFLATVLIALLILIIWKALLVYLTPSAVITYFTADKGTYHAGDKISFNLKLKNTGRRKFSFWVEYSLKDQSNNEYYKNFEQVSLNAGQESGMETKTLQIPDYSIFDNLNLNYEANILDSRNNPKILDSKEIAGALQIPIYSEEFLNFNSKYWLKADYTFDSNRGYLKAENTSLENGLLKMGLPADSYDGAGIESKNTYKYGTYSARINCPTAPGTLCTFFLYQPTEDKKSDEIDIEIYNDNSRKIDFVAWLAGKKINYYSAYLPFDPSIGFHQYRIDFYPNYLSFYADGNILQRWTQNLPTHAMKIISNLWWPDWLNYPKLKSEQFMYLDRIDYQPFIY